MKIFFINLDRRQDRLIHTVNNLNFHGVEYERVSAIDYKDFLSIDENGKEYVDQSKVKNANLLNLIQKEYFCTTTSQNDLMKLKSYNFEKDLVNMSISEVCVAQSHRKAWKLAQNYEYSLIIEDDITFFLRLKELFNDLENIKDKLNFDIFLLGWGDKNNFLSLKPTDFKICSNSQNIFKINAALYLQAYIIKGEIAKKLSESTIIGPVDEYLSTIYPNINCYGIDVSFQTERDGDNGHSSFTNEILLA